MKRIAIIVTIAAMLLSGCGVMKQDNSVSQEEQGKVTTMDPLLLQDVKQTVKLDEKTSIVNDIENYDVTVTKFYLSDKIEEDIDEWQDTAFEAQDGLEKTAISSDGQLPEGYRVIYVEMTVTNNFDDSLNYGDGSFQIYKSVDGELQKAVEEIGYDSQATSGKSMNIAKIKKGESKQFRMGYIIDSDTADEELYLELTNISSDDASDFIVLPMEKQGE